MVHILSHPSFRFYTYQFFLVAHNFPSLALYPHGAIEAFILAVPYANIFDISEFYKNNIRYIKVLHQIGRLTCGSHHNFAAIQGIGCEINCLLYSLERSMHGSLFHFRLCFQIRFCQQQEQRF